MLVGIVLWTVAPSAQPVLVQFEIEKSHPHDPDAYTQGLLFHDGYLYESTGKYGRSTVRRVDLDTGEAFAVRPLSREFFGEGLARVGNRLYQLTWKARRGFVYDLRTLDPVGEFRYQGEGWGLASDGSLLYMSNGSSVISVRNPEDFAELRKIHVHGQDVPTSNLNELEIIDGMIWANVYRSPIVLIIDPTTGEVTGYLDLQNLAHRQPRSADVLNGIAYDAEADRLFVTGKFWPTLYELRLAKSD